MKLFGREFFAAKTNLPATSGGGGELVAKALPDTNLYPVPSSGSYFGGLLSTLFTSVTEPFAGAWQRNIQVETPQNILGFSAAYACLSTIAADISKLRIKLMAPSDEDPTLSEEVLTGSPFLPVLRKPNRYQTRIQFISQWLCYKLTWGNTYVLMERDARGVVIAFYILDSRCVKPYIADDGSVWYGVHKDILAGIPDNFPLIPASEIIHDRGPCLWHPLVGVSPIFAAGGSATHGLRMQKNAERFFENMSRPSGMLTAPGKISNEAAQRLKDMFETNFGASNIGRLFVAGEGLDYKPIAWTFEDSQIIQQLDWTAKDVAVAFHMPLYKVGGPLPPLNNVAALNQEYYNQTLHELIESIELLLDEALGLAGRFNTEFDIEPILRMDPMTRAQVNRERIGAGYMKINEARATENWEPVEGGDTPYLQQQNYALSALAKRDAAAPAPGSLGGGGAPAPALAPPGAPAPARESAPPASATSEPPAATGSASEQDTMIAIVTKLREVADSYAR